MRPVIRYILITAVRDRIFIGLFILLTLAAAICLMLGGTAFIESHAMALALTAGSIRMIIMLGLIVFACFHIRSAFDNKEMDVMLSRPLARWHLLLACWAGYAMVAWLLCLPVLLVVALFGSADMTGYMAWGVSLLLETLLVLAMAIFSAFTLRSAALSVMGCAGLYVLSRMMAFFIMTSQSGIAANGSWSWMKHILELVSILVPRLDMFTQSQWLVYGAETLSGWWYVPLQAIIFIPLLLLAAMLDFRRREF